MVRFEFWFYKYFVPLGLKVGARIDGFIFKRTLETPHQDLNRRFDRVHIACWPSESLSSNNFPSSLSA